MKFWKTIVMCNSEEELIEVKYRYKWKMTFRVKNPDRIFVIFDD